MNQAAVHNLFVRVSSLSDLQDKGRLVVKASGRQIALFLIPGSEHEIYACNNRCPHEGYPLIEGNINEACQLTCNWHNWKFDLATGKTLIGGDQLRQYPVKVVDDEVLLDLSDPPLTERVAQILKSLTEAMPEHEYDRIAREIARLIKVGGDPLDALRAAIHYSYDRFEYGSGHAYAATVDWLGQYIRLCDAAADDRQTNEIALVPLFESIGHIAWDTQRQPQFKFTTDSHAWDPQAFADAIELQDEHAAVAIVRGALEQGNGFEALRPSLIKAALAHYQGFGHALIYTYKAGQLIGHLGGDVETPVVLALIRYLCNAAREDLIPEFKAYAPALAEWGSNAEPIPEAHALVNLSVAKVLKTINQSGADPQTLFNVMFHAASIQLLSFDHTMDNRSQNSISQNANWLDFTHTITFGNALRWACGHSPDQWSQGLLQMGCFLGRNCSFLDSNIRTEDWAVENLETEIEQALHAHLDHQYPEYIVSCHYLKLLVALREELQHAPTAAWREDLGSALKRMQALPIKRKHMLRTAHQAMSFVHKED